MSSQPNVDADREHRLIEQLELRIAGANTDAKFETVISKFLAALILKVGSENVRNKNLAIKICQHVNQRLKLDSSISLPIPALLKTFRESQNAFISRFALVFIEQGLGRLPPEQRSNVLPEVLQGSILESNDYNGTQSKMWSVAFDFLLDVLSTWRIPDHATKEEIELGNTFRLSAQQSQVLSDMLSNFISYDSRTKSCWKPISLDFEPVFEKHNKLRSQVIVPIAKFLFTSVFSDAQRFAPAILLSVDANDTACGIADVMFKQCEFDFEQDSSVDLLFNIFDLGRPKLQMKALVFLSRSQRSTNRPTKILQIVEQQLFRNNTGLEASKLRSAVFQYLTWAVRVSSDLSSVQERLQTLLREFIELQGWPTMAQANLADFDLRAKAYESIGLLAAIKSPEATMQSTVSLDMITWLFTSLRCDTSRDIRASVDEALSRVLNIAKFTSEEDLHHLKALLLWNVTAQEGDQDPTYYFPTVNSTRYLAVRFANKVLSFDDVDARYIDVLSLGINDRREVSEEGNRGLDPYWHTANAKLSNNQGKALRVSFPKSDNFITRLFNTEERTRMRDLQVSALAAAVVFGRNLLIHESLDQSHSEMDSGFDWTRNLDAIIRNDAVIRRSFNQYLERVDPLNLIRLIENSILGMSLGSVACADVTFDLVSLSSNHVLQQLDPKVLLDLKKAALNNVVQAQATRVFGIVASLSPSVSDVMQDGLVGSSTWSTAIGQAAIGVRASILCTGYTVTRLALRGFMETAKEPARELYALLSKIILSSSDKSLKHAAYSVIGQMCLAMSSEATMFTQISDLISPLVSEAKKEDELAVMVLGRILGILYAQSEEQGKDLLDRLYGLHEVRKPELHFALGESLATAALGFKSESTLTDFDVDASKPNSSFKSDLFDKILDRAVTDSKTTKPSLKKASAIWLLSLIQFCTDLTLLKRHLRDCQIAFARLLNDRDEIVQETGARGLGLVYEKGDKSLQDDLVRDLVQSFTGGDAKMSGTVNEDTELFEAGALPTEGGQSVQTYKDIVSLATEMGDPSLVYRFMNLASNNAIWSSRAAFGRFGLSGVLADSTYLTENKKFYPKLFRYRFDPNPNVQRSMDDIWKALVKDSNKVMDENFDLIITDLLKSIVSGKDWRAREASCAAISDLIQGREVEKFEVYLDDIWNVAFKVLDDVKETVRLAAMKLCRTLTNMLIRNLEVGEGTSKRAITMMQHGIPFLLRQMESGSAQEVQQYAVITLLDIVKKSPLRSLSFFAPEILERLILSLSSLEHESINYLHLNADKYGLTAEKLDKMRVSSINASPVSEAIERCLDSLFGKVSTADDTHSHGEGHTANDNSSSVASGGGNSATADAIHRLESAFKTAIGLPSKVGLSRVMITLVVRHQAAFRPHADRFLQLTRKYILDRNATISISFSMALGYLVRLASQKEVDETSRYAQRLYFDSQELSHRAVAGEIIQAISKASNDVFMKFASTFLPFAFVGRNDLDPDVRKRFEEPWKDNVGGSRTLNLYLSEIVGLISKHITSSLWPIRQASALAVANLVTSMEGTDQYSEVEARLLWQVVEESLNGKTWEGKEKVVLAYPKFIKRSRSIWTEKGQQMKSISMREAKRANVAYRPHALTALGEVASTRADLEFDEDVLEVLTNVFDQLEEQGDAMDVDGGEEQGSSVRHADATAMAAFQCLFQILTEKSNPNVLDQALGLVNRAYGKMSAKIDIGICDGARQYITQATRGGLSSSDVGGGQVRITPAGGHQCHKADSDGLKQQQQQHEHRAAFLHGLVLALFDTDECSRRHPSDSESLRKSRVSLAMALAERGSLDARSVQVLIPTLKGCLQGERSRPLRLDLEKTLRVLESCA